MELLRKQPPEIYFKLFSYMAHRTFICESIRKNILLFFGGKEGRYMILCDHIFFTYASWKIDLFCKNMNRKAKKFNHFPTMNFSQEFPIYFYCFDI